jgi:hypothetical protein
MFTEIKIITWLGLFAIYFIFDILYVRYVLSVSKLNAFQAANIGALMYLLTGIGIVQFVDNFLNIIPIIIGSWFGTFLAIKFESYKNKKKKDKKI